MINKNSSVWNTNTIIPTNKARRPGTTPYRIFNPVEEKLKTEQKRIDDLVKKIVDFPVELKTKPTKKSV